MYTVYTVVSPLLSLNVRMLAEYIVYGRRYKGSTIDRIISLYFSPVHIAFFYSRSISIAIAKEAIVGGSLLSPMLHVCLQVTLMVLS